MVWQCRAHGVEHHKFFINYRVAADKESAEKLAYALDTQRISGQPVTTFLDSRCLVVGESWQDGFVNGLQKSAVVILLISEAGLQNIRYANERQDNVLLEYEKALEKYDNNEICLFPLAIAKRDGGAIIPFSAYNVDVYPDGPHKASGKNVRQTMQKLFSLQLREFQPHSTVSVDDRVAEIMGKLKLHRAFGTDKEISELTRVPSHKSGNALITYKLAPHFGKLKQNGAIKQMDKFLKATIAGTIRKLGEMNDSNWETVLSVMSQNVMLEPYGDEIKRSDKLIKDSWNYFKFDGSAEKSVINEVLSWFVTLISDDDIIQATNINIELAAKIVAATGARVTDFATLMYKKSYEETDMIDIGVLRYPDIDAPYFKVYRIRIVAWSDCSRILFAQKDVNGIRGEFNVRRYKPRDSVLKAMKGEVIEKAAAEAESLFLD